MRTTARESLHGPVGRWRSAQEAACRDRYPLSKVVSHSFPLAEVNKAFDLAEWQSKGGGTAATRVILKP